MPAHDRAACKLLELGKIALQSPNAPQSPNASWRRNSPIFAAIHSAAILVQTNTACYLILQGADSLGIFKYLHSYIKCLRAHNFFNLYGMNRVSMPDKGDPSSPQLSLSLLSWPLHT